MTSKQHTRAALCALILITSSLGALAFRPPEERPLPDFDVRIGGADAASRTPTPGQQYAEAAWRLAVPDLTLRWNVRSGSPKWMAGPPGTPLAAPFPGSHEEAALAFLTRESALLGLTDREVAAVDVSTVVPAPDGGAHVHLTQRLGGVEFLDSHAVVNVNADGSIRSLGSSLWGGVRVAIEPHIDAAEALRLATADVYPDVPFVVDVVAQDEDAPDRRTVFDGAEFGRDPTARLVVLPDDRSGRLAWEVRVSEAMLFTDYQVVVDAEDGRILLRRNLTRYATANALDSRNPEVLTEEFEPDNWTERSIPDAAAPTAESPNGWIDGAGTELRGNNAVSRPGYIRNPPLADPTGDYALPFNSTRSAMVNAWWVANEIHDHLRALGFDEARGNFQQDNFGLGGLGGDPMDVIVYGLGGRGNAFYGGGGADGELPQIVFLWGNCDTCADHDSYPENGGDRHTAFDGGVLVHEYAHGVTTRLIGGPALSCQFGLQTQAMDEGWSDYFANSYHDQTVLGEYFVGRRGFLRSPLNDMDYGDLCDVGNSCGYHDNGMIWQAIVWDLRTAFVALDPVGGVDDVDRLLLESLASSSCFPSFVDARDAVLDADQALYGGSHRGVIWNVFAKRGLGQGAFSFGPDDTSPTASYTVPITSQCLPPAAPGTLSATPDGANAIRLDYAATGASAVEIRREDVGNAFDRTETIGYTTSTSTYTDASVQGGRTYRYEVVPLGSAGPPCAGGASPTADATATGTCSGAPVFDPQPTVADNPDCSITLSWQPAQPLCAGEPVLYDVYRGASAGFEPSERMLIGQTDTTTFTDTPPGDGQPRYYLVLAQHGSPGAVADHSDRGSHQVLKWTPALPATARTVVQSWDFESGAQGWTADNTADPSGGWTLVAPTGTHYGGGPFAPDEAAGGSGMAWVTGDAGGPSAVHEFDSDGPAELISPVFDGTGGATLLSFDYWSHDGSEYVFEDIGLLLVADNGTESVTVRAISGMTVQDFDSAGRHSWQRAELDLATLLEPTSTMTVKFVPNAAVPLTEFGVDNVRVDSAQTCARSALSIRSVSIDDGNAGGGNGNGVLDPGETVFVEVELANDGPVTAFAPTGTLVAPGVLATVHDDTATFPDIPPGGSGIVSGFSLTLSETAACQETAALDFTFVDAAGTRSDESFDVELGLGTVTVVFQDDFETDTGWILVNDPGPGAGQWQRADPVGTSDDGSPANPESDSPNDAGAMCYVTENGPIGGAADDHDVDATYVDLRSPKLDFRPYKRLWMTADVWFYNDSEAADVFEDSSRLDFNIDDGELAAASVGTIELIPLTTSGWETFTAPIRSPLVDQVRVGISVSDQGPGEGPAYTDSTVEAGIDNVVVEGESFTCDPVGVTLPPNGIGDTLRASRDAAAVTLSWTVPPVDAEHDGAAYYRAFASPSADVGFDEFRTTAQTALARVLGETATAEFYLVSAVNGAGDSGDAPVP